MKRVNPFEGPRRWIRVRPRRATIGQDVDAEIRFHLELLQGTLDLLVLKALLWGPRHGFAVARWIRETTGETILVEDRALYVSLHRLEARGWVESSWGFSENNRRAKYYRITRPGRRALEAKTADWTAYAAAVFKVLKTTDAT